MRSGLWVLVLAALIIVVVGCHRVQEHAEVGKMTIYYFPIEIETLTPVTSTNIEERGRRCEIHNIEDIEKIKNVLRGAAKPASQGFSDKAVRVKLLEASPKDDMLVALVEHEGEVRFADGTEGTLPRRDLDRLENIIEARCR